MIGSIDERALKDLISKQAITEALAYYCRGIDRCDLASLQSAFWPDGVANYGQADINAWSWSETVIEALLAMDRTQHAISNVLIELNGDSATVETYCRAYHELTAPDGRKEIMVGGRYLDRFEERDGEWRISHRRYVMDWNQNGPSTSIWGEGFYAGLTVVGRRSPDDPLYAAGGSDEAR